MCCVERAGLAHRDGSRRTLERIAADLPAELLRVLVDVAAAIAVSPPAAVQIGNCAWCQVAWSLAEIPSKPCITPATRS